jgi:glycosyltransferase involved in cell wall biosynthesis
MPMGTSLRSMISVIIPTYNRASFLAEAIQSVLDQDYFRDCLKEPCFEFLVIDDGSTDRTEMVVRSFGDRVKYFYQQHQGISAARNQGLRLSSGDFIAFLDSDDLWMSNKMTAQMSFMEAFPKAKVFEVVGDFDESIPACEDYDLSIRLAHRFPVHLIDSPLIVKRGGHADQLSRQFWGMDRFRVYALEKALKMDLTPDQERLVKEEIIKKCQILVQGFQKRKKRHETQRYLSLIQKYQQKKEEK